MRLVDDWKQAWKWISVNCMVIAGAIQGAWASVPDDLHDKVPYGVVAAITVAILVLGVIGRLLRQDKA